MNAVPQRDDKECHEIGTGSLFFFSGVAVLVVSGGLLQREALEIVFQNQNVTRPVVSLYWYVFSLFPMVVSEVNKNVRR